MRATLWSCGTLDRRAQRWPRSQWHVHEVQCRYDPSLAMEEKEGGQKVADHPDSSLFPVSLSLTRLQTELESLGEKEGHKENAN
mmetsp:Transcript_22764/g.46624  ORF Transcript_22764/g.46624 Transcript_22764/m.46624 type:complete len:84 (+) Transcript_22764:2687-2938(+)